jgi:hypothetical protein
MGDVFTARVLKEDGGLVEGAGRSLPARMAVQNVVESTVSWDVDMVDTR